MTSLNQGLNFSLTTKEAGKIDPVCCIFNKTTEAAKYSSVMNVCIKELCSYVYE